MSRHFHWVVLAAILMGPGTDVSAALESAPKKVSYPDEGVELGAGWDALEARKTSGSCIAFSRNQRTPPQESATQIRRVVDHYTFDEALDLSAEMKMQKFLGFGGSAKARYSERTKVASDQTSFMLSAWVANEAEFVEPRSGEAEIYLLPELALLAKSNPAAFRLRCGDHFVSSLWTGAELFGFVSFQSDEETTRQALSTELEASGFLLSGGGSFSQVMNKYKKNIRWNMTYFQSGGSGEPIPTNEAEFIQAARSLRTSATLAPRRMSIAIRPYTEIKGWPANDPISGPPSDYDVLVAKLAEEIRLYDDLALVIANPSQYEIGYPKSVQDLRNWQDQVQVKIAQYKQQLGNCVQKRIRADCGQPLTGDDLKLGLLNSIDLPVPKRSVEDLYTAGGPACIPWDGVPCKDKPPTLNREYHPTAVANAIYQLRLEERSRGYCAIDRSHPYCLANATKKAWRDFLFARLKLPSPGPLPITAQERALELDHRQVLPPKF